MVSIGVFYVFGRIVKEYGSVLLRLGKADTGSEPVVQLFPAGMPGQLIKEYQPPALVATEGAFDSGRSAPIVRSDQPMGIYRILFRLMRTNLNSPVKF
jgi:hypothetical protein